MRKRRFRISERHRQQRFKTPRLACLCDARRQAAEFGKRAALVFQSPGLALGVETFHPTTPRQPAGVCRKGTFSNGV
ncbi:MAG: hypothetical protein G01um10148_447 [Parcubacteria group bacterium Gr01-1014_8]|nr:MAG: hypothetical protein G01um10148_447 [Parcubacteria group bacterium Gr01-1014_8]